jgi:hypothetical protein
MSDDSFGLRALNEALFKALGIYQPQTKQTVFADSGFEMFSSSGEHLFPITEAKAYTKPRNVEIVDLIVGHISAVSGGFGVSKARKKYWLKALQGSGGHISPLLLRQFPTPILLVEDAAERLALWERFANVPYHEIALQNGDAIANHPLSRHSWHADGGNTGVGLAIDCGPNEKLSSWLVETGRFAFKVLHARLSKETTRAHLRYAPHRAFSADRRRDTNPFVHSEIMKPAISEINRTPRLLAVEIDYSLHTGGGLPVPNSWDSDSPFDDKGRNLRP